MTAIPKNQVPIPRPRLSDRNLARFVRKPASRQMRFLHDLKFPRGAPQVFMRPYYGSGLAGIRDVMKRGFRGIIDSRAKLETIGQETRRKNNMRVLDSFIESPHAKRKLKVVTAHRYQASIRSLEIRFSPHVVAMEGDVKRYIYFHETSKQCDPEEARLTLEFGFWVLRQNDVDVQPDHFELIDLFSGRHIIGQPIRPSTLMMLDELAQSIESQWPTIDP